MHNHQMEMSEVVRLPHLHRKYCAIHACFVAKTTNYVCFLCFSDWDCSSLVQKCFLVK